MTQEEIRQKLSQYQQQIKHIELNIKHLQLDCEHPDMQRRGYAFVGNYWHECPDCRLVK